MARLDAFLQLGYEQGVSDMHFAVGVPPMFRISGDLLPIKYRALTDEELQTLLYEILDETQQQQLESGEDLDFSYANEGIGRFRAHVLRKASGLGAVFRVITTMVPELGALGLPPVIEKLTHHHQGLLLVTGATGTGKSSTLAAIISSRLKTQLNSCIKAKCHSSCSARLVSMWAVLPKAYELPCAKTRMSYWLASCAIAKRFLWQ
jgi:twitching motility protein PilT